MPNARAQRSLCHGSLHYPDNDAPCSGSQAGSLRHSLAARRRRGGRNAACARQATNRRAGANHPLGQKVKELLLVFDGPCRLMASQHYTRLTVFTAQARTLVQLDFTFDFADGFSSKCRWEDTRQVFGNAACASDSWQSSQLLTSSAAPSIIRAIPGKN